MTTMKSLHLVLLYTFVLNYPSEYQLSFISAYTLTPSQSLKDGQILTSQSEMFELGFFSPPNSKTRYLGIWYKKIPVQTVVWVANRVSPLNDTLGELLLSAAGHLVILRRPNHVIWSTNSSKIAENPIVEFLQSGNLVLRDRNSEEPLWQSFDYPSDTLLPDMKVGRDLRSGLNRYLRSWKSVDDPSLGDYTFEFELSGDPETFIKNGSNKYYRSGPWNGLRNSGAPDAKNNSIFKYELVINENDFYYRYQLVNKAVTSRLILIQTGNEGFVERFTWVDQRQSWVLHVPVPRDRCDHYGICGPGSICDMSNNPVCRCLKGFKPRSPRDYNEMDWSKGCKLETPLHCDQKVGFEKFVEVKLPDTMRTWRNTSMSLEECRVECIKNCSCTAYANVDIRGDGSGCVMWFGYLIDIRKVSGAGQDLYIRMSASELEADVPKETRKDIERNKAKKIIVTISGISSVLLLGALLCFIWRKKITQRIHKLSSNQIVQKEKIKSAPFHKGFKHGKRDQPGEKNEDLELNIFDLETIVRATCNFSSINMLGQGGYGCVYKGTLKDGQEIAVKRLSKNSRQGVKEFKNEVILIARLQHRNLVRLLGLCIEGEEKILIYEYLENKGLDAMLFDKTFSFILDWPKRFNIIAGISRGLLYLHQDSRFRIIHRDLKTSNVLLDGKLNPKISDFGMARIFGGDDTEAETRRVTGTYGYMPPEYAMDGIFSIKSDVYSFGVLLLEIISGKKNRGLFGSDNKVNLLGHAWKLLKEGRALELIDETMKESCIPNEALRCIHIGLLCVQEHAKDRPTMSSVVLMLSTDTTKLEQPRPPGFCFGRSDTEANSTSSKQESCSANDVTITNLEAR